jgi:beta-lactamase regulating signal transducer with metallopeptidase domain
MNALAGLIDPIYRFVVEASLGGSVVVCALLVVQWVFAGRLTPRARHLLWGVLLLRLMLPWTPQSPLSAANLLPIASLPAAAPFDVQQAVDLQGALSPAVGAGTPEGPPSTTPAFDWGTAARVAWLAGSLLWGLHVLMAYKRLPRALRALRPVSDARALAVLGQCKADMRVRWPRVILYEAQIAFPLVCGLIRPRLVLPEGAARTLTDTELRHVFLHELAHLKRADLAVGLVCAVLQAMHWFNPLVWYAFQRMRQDREYACDALALSRMPQGEGGRYGETLIKLVQDNSRPVPVACAAGIAENRSELGRRIQMIARHASSSYRLTLAGVVLFGFCAVVFLTRAIAVPEIPVPLPASPAEFPYAIEVETYATSWSAFRPGDSIEITEVRGTAPQFEVGQRYEVKGRYVLASEKRALLMLHCTNGEVAPSAWETVERGEGEFTRRFGILEPGMLHLNYYPDGGGDGFGGTYFRKKTVPADSPDAVVDLATSDADFAVRKMDNATGYSLHVVIHNNGNAVSPAFDIWFYEGDPETTEPRTHGGGELSPGEVWREMTNAIDLKEGSNTFYVKIDPNNEIEETDETNNVAKVTVQGKKVVREVIELE